MDMGTSLLVTVERNPNALALIDGNQRLTYSQLLEGAQRLRTGLENTGLTHGDHLITLLQNRLEAVILYWACQLAGIVITPINWRASGQELNHVITDSGAKLLVFEPASAAAVAECKSVKKLIILGLNEAGDDTGGNAGGSISYEELLDAPPSIDPPSAEDNDISLMLYTSGTTGQGKGVPRTHRAERAATIAHIVQNQYAPGERTLGVMPLYHTMGVRALLSMALLNGVFVCQRRFNAAEALGAIEKEKISNLYLVPTLYHDLVHSEVIATTDISSVTKLGFAGATMTEGLLQKLNQVFEPALFINHYGSSEIYTFSIERNAVAKPGSAGKAGFNQQIRVIDLDRESHTDMVAPNQEGQIIARLNSEEAFSGYHNRPDADAKSIQGDWYYTGDIGYQDEDGDLFVTGRVDDMIISGGENILPAEIESVLSLYEGVSEVAVVGLPDERWGQIVTAFIQRCEEIDADQLDSWCLSSGLAPFKRPRKYVFVKAIPKSPVGKILRRKLKAGEYDTDTLLTEQD